MVLLKRGHRQKNKKKIKTRKGGTTVGSLWPNKSVKRKLVLAKGVIISNGGEVKKFLAHLVLLLTKYFNNIINVPLEAVICNCLSYSSV